MASHFSIKWKLSISFVALSLGLVSLYIIMAKQTFESDKIYYIFESEQAQLESLSHDINEQIERILFDSRSLLAGFDFQSSSLSPLGKSLFQEHKYILAIEIWDHADSKSILKIEKVSNILPSFSKERILVSQTPLATNSARLIIERLDTQKFLISSSQQTLKGGTLWLRVVAEFSNLLPKSPTGHLILSQKNQILAEAGHNKVQTSVAEEIIENLSKDRAEKTSLQDIQNRKYFISSTSLKYDGLRLSSIVDSEIALHALNVLYFRSLIFLVFAVLATALIAVLLSSKLTEQLEILTERAVQIGNGDFSSKLDVNSNDEVGVLSKAFLRMSTEIERLLIETKDKTRMEQELKTAKIVQESLFPKIANFKSDAFHLSGLFATSSECSGDWWYYFERGDDLFIVIADATGHGTSAALITSAARSLFAQIEISSSTLSEMATQWDRAIASCSNKTLYMTALLLQVTKSSGLVRCLNASHELPFLIRGDKENHRAEPVMLAVNRRIGEFVGNEWIETNFTLAQGETLLLFTDGLTSIENSLGKPLNERKLMKAMSQVLEENPIGAEHFCNKVYELFENHRLNAPLTDDVTLVVLQRLSG